MTGPHVSFRSSIEGGHFVCMTVMCCFISFQQFVLKKLLEGQKVAGRVGAAQAKMTIIIAYIIFIGAINLLVVTYFGEDESVKEELVNIILCESGGTSPECSSLNKSTTDILSILFTTTTVLTSCIPILVLLLNCKNAKTSRKKKPVMSTSASRKNLVQTEL